MRRRLAALLIAALTCALLPVAASASDSSNPDQPSRASGHREAADYDIVGGQLASPGEYPFQVAIIHEQYGPFCGGTLIDSNWVLTAAHCFYDPRTGGSEFLPDELLLVLGGDDDLATADHEVAGVSQIVLHPAYDDLQTLNDIALLRLTASTAVPTIPLVPADRPDLSNPPGTAWTIGYGVTEFGAESIDGRLREVEVPLISDQECAQFYLLDAERHLCAGFGDGRDSCQGDSGGPLIRNPGDGTWVQIGIVSFGYGCGTYPGVYTQVSTYLAWIAATMSTGSPSPDPGNPPPDPSDAIRIVAPGTTGDDPVQQAAQISSQVFVDGSADYAVIARGDLYPDALGGSSLAWGVAPLLFAGPAGTLDPVTVAELQRAVTPGGVVYVLGGEAALPPALDQQLVSLGYRPFRLAGGAREATAAAVAAEQLARFDGQLWVDIWAVATSGNWPDAVTVGQIGSWWGSPILLTPQNLLHPDTRAILAQHRPGLVLVIGGEAAISSEVEAEIAAVTGGQVIRLGGASRTGTAAQITLFNTYDLFPAIGASPAYIVAVNLRRADAYAHVLAATMITGGFGAVFAPVEGDAGDIVTQDVLDSICGMDVPVVVAGGTNLVSDAAVAQIQAASAGQGCAVG